MINEKDILKDILVGEDETISNLSTIIKKAKEIFVVEKTGKVIFKNYSKLKNNQKVCALLIGKYFAKRLDLIKDHSMKSSDISEELSIPNTTLSAPLKSLKDRGIVLKDKESFRINPHRIEEVVDDFFQSDLK